jgi:membrane fusion protein (multidrug efflux system)
LKITNNSFVFFFTISVITVSLSACGNNDNKIGPPGSGAARPNPVINVDGYLVRTQTIVENIEVGGSLLANESTEINPEISGRLVYLNVNEGRNVSRGALIGRIYDGDLQAQLKKLQVQLQIARQTQSRFGELLKVQGISQQEFDQASLQVSNIMADMDIVRADITKTQIRAPFNGKLGLKNISPGSYVTPATIVATIQQVSQLKLDFTVPEKYSGQISNGQYINFTVDGSDKKYSARIMAIESSVSQTTRSLMVRSIVQNNDGLLLPGSFAKVILNFAPNENAIMVPAQAVIPQARGKKIIVAQKGSPVFVEVTTGYRDSVNVQITSGLNVGDTVVLTGLLSIKPESKINVDKIVN